MNTHGNGNDNSSSNDSNLSSIAHWGIGEWAAYCTLAIAIIGIIIRNEQRMTKIEITQDITAKILDKLESANIVAAQNAQQLQDIKSRLDRADDRAMNK